MTYVDFLKNEVLLIHWQHSGYANMNTKRNLFCIDDPKNGAALFRLCEDKVIAMRKFSVPETQTNIRARGVDFTTEDENIVMGSDHGRIYVFNMWSGKVLCRLDAGSRLSRVQTITVSDHSETFL